MSVTQRWPGCTQMPPDPICGMTVDEKTAMSAVRDGVTSYFCSESC